MRRRAKQAETKVTSADGTEIGYTAVGSGPVLVNVDGAMCSRTFGPARDLAKALERDFTVVTYDRRGRGTSGAGASAYALEREIEDLAAVIAANGGRASVFASSSGAALALEAARAGTAIDRLVCYEVPFVLDDARPANDADLPAQLEALVAAGKRGAAVSRFMRTVGVPAPARAAMRLTPSWERLKAVAHTLPYDLGIVVPFQQGKRLPRRYYDRVACPVLVLAGGSSPAYLQHSQALVAKALPRGRLETLPGQTHAIKAAVIAPVVTEFLQH